MVSKMSTALDSDERLKIETDLALLRMSGTTSVAQRSMKRRKDARRPTISVGWSFLEDERLIQRSITLSRIQFLGYI